MWFLVSLHFQDLCFGYEALQFIDAETTGRMYMYWNIIIGNLLQDIMTYQKMQKLVEKLEAMYDRDALTGMYNRRGFENRGNPMFEQAKEEGKQIFLAIIDMDGMKQINDNYGHIEGDYALKKVREAIHHACPDAVIQARTGGDEFEIIAEDIGQKMRGFIIWKNWLLIWMRSMRVAVKNMIFTPVMGMPAAFLRSRIPWKFSLKKVMKSCIGIK